MKFFKIIRYDIYHGIFKNLLKLIPLALFCIAICWGFLDNLKYMNLQDKIVISTGNYFALLFSGISPYVPSPDNQFQIPVNWLFLHIYLIWFMGSYASSDLKGVGQNILVRCASRSAWWHSKIVFCYASTTVYYITIFLSALFMGNFFGTPSLHLQQPFAAMQLSAEFVELSLSKQMTCVYFLPFLVLLTMSLLKLAVDFIFTPAISTIVVVIIYIASIYYTSPLLIGEYSMLMRHRTVTENGMHEHFGIVICVSIILIVYFVGYQKFKHFDILDNKEV